MKTDKKLWIVTEEEIERLMSYLKSKGIEAWLEAKELTPSELSRIKSLIIDDLEYVPKGESDEELEALLKKLEELK